MSGIRIIGPAGEIIAEFKDATATLSSGVITVQRDLETLGQFIVGQVSGWKKI